MCIQTTDTMSYNCREKSQLSLINSYLNYIEKWSRRKIKSRTCLKITLKV